jgi:hypothetical protein
MSRKLFVVASVQSYAWKGTAYVKPTSLDGTSVCVQCGCIFIGLSTPCYIPSMIVFSTFQKAHAFLGCLLNDLF